MPYLITEKTYALIPLGKKTKIIEETTTKTINKLPIEIISSNCIYYGSTLEGRQKGSAYLINTRYKPPILLDNKTNMIMIPTHSERNKDCIWFNLSSIKNYKAVSNKVNIEFYNNKIITLDYTYAKFDKQVLRAMRLESTLRNRNNLKNL